MNIISGCFTQNFYDEKCTKIYQGTLQCHFHQDYETQMSHGYINSSQVHSTIHEIENSEMLANRDFELLFCLAT